MNVLECIRKCDYTKVGIMITTDKCYENKEQIWGYRENDPMGGYDPYSSSKGCCELLIAAYRNSFMNPKDYETHGKSIASVRAGNVIGGGDWSKDRIIPDCIRSLIKGEDIKIRNPKAVRPWQHVLEPIYGYMVLAKKMYEDGVKYASGWNFGPMEDSIITVKDIVNIIINKWGSGKIISLSNETDFYEANFLRLDCTKSKLLLGWNPKLSIEETLSYTIEWYENFYNNNFHNNDFYESCTEQIGKYIKLF